MLAAYAQEDMQKVNIGVRLGLGGSTLMLPQMSKASLGTKGYNASQKMQIGGTAGVMADFMLKEKWSLQTGVMYSLQRFTQTQSSVYTDTANVNYSLSTDNTYKMHRLRVPVMLTYHSSRENNHLSVSAGLYADCALSGDIANTFNMVSVDGDTSTNDMVTVLANGMAGNDEITADGADFATVVA